MRILSQTVVLWIAVVLALPAASLAEDAPSLDELRRSGVVGERYDGTLVVRNSDAPERVRALVERINEERRSIYRERAKEQGVDPAQVGRVYTQQIFQKAPDGTWFLGEDGAWSQK